MMTSTWALVVILLLSWRGRVRSEGLTEPCANIQTNHSVVLLGSPVSATCVITEKCLELIGQSVHMEWYLNEEVLPSSFVTNESDRKSRVVIPRFNHTWAFLTCCIQMSPTQVVGGVEIRAGFLPEPPQILGCQTNLSSPITMSCTWEAGRRDTHLPTDYSLHTRIWDSNEYRTYNLTPDLGRYVIPRSDFALFTKMEMYVKAVNQLGETSSAPLTLEPMSVAKFDPPNIVLDRPVVRRLGCLKLHWSLAQEQNWMRFNNQFNLEVQIRTTDSGQRSEWTTPRGKVSPSIPLDLCHLLHGTLYFFRVRVQYKQSPWSEWSSRQSGITLETAPTGRLSTWTRLSEDHVQKLYLFWKPSKQFRANSQNVSYVVSEKRLSKKWNLCQTLKNYCSFQLKREVKKIYLQAVNAAGRSSPTEVHVLQQKVSHSVLSDLRVTPQDTTGFLVQWKTMDVSQLTGQVVQWWPLVPGDLSSTQFERVDTNQSSLVIAGGVDPYTPYRISVYPRFKDGIGFPLTVEAYSRQKAPLEVPKINIVKKWENKVELFWEEIPLEQRNGIIQNYRVFYREEEGPVQVVTADVEERKVVLENLKTSTLYEAFLMVSTSGGSLNGSWIHFKVEPFDAVAVVMSVSVSLVSLLLVVIFLVNCLSAVKRLKSGFWPAVPDPANSSIKRWTSESSQYTYPSMDSDEPDPVFLEHLDLELPLKTDSEQTHVWTRDFEDTSDLGTSICGSPFSLEDPASRSDSVPYATVIFSGPCDSPRPALRHTYLHSESTQPLLETEESFVPVCYQNTAPDGTLQECFFGTEDSDLGEEETETVGIWNDFPFLQALALYDAPNN